MNTFFDLKQKEGLRETDLWVILDEEKWWKHKPSHDHDGGLLAEVGREIPEEWISEDERAKRNPNKFKK